MQTALTFLRLLALSIWLGGLIFFAFVLAPIAFHVLPSVNLAGLVVGATLRAFHVVGLIAGIIFCLASGFLALTTSPTLRRRLTIELLLTGAMIAVTTYLQASILPAMELDRTKVGGDIDAVPANNPARLHFNKFHTLSERLEGAVLFTGLGVLFVLASEPHRHVA